jgi:RND family efflux transporter MFP subunit
MPKRSLSGKILFLLTALSAVLSACSVLSSAFQAPTPPTFVIATATVSPAATAPAGPTVTVERGDITRTVNYSASIVSQTETTLQFQIGGQVAQLMVQPGDPVKKGDLLAQLQTTVSDFDLKRAQSNLDKANLLYQQALLDTPSYQKDYKEIIALKKIDVDQAQISVDELKGKLDAAKLMAPLDGEVTSLYINVGDTVVPFKPVMVVVDPNKLEVRAFLPASDYAALVEKMPVSISLTSGSSTIYAGNISQLLASASDPNQPGIVNIYAAKIAFNDAPPTSLSVGTPVNVQMDVEKKSGVLWLPPNALQGTSPSQFVNVQDGNKPVKVNVQVGLSTDQKVEITQGLTEGQIVLLP